MKRITIKQLHAETGAQVRRARRVPLEVTDHGRPIAVIVGPAEFHREIFERIRALRSRLKLNPAETVRDLVQAGRRL
jgi:prevent-host-death family protein